MTELSLTITREDIRNGTAHNSNSCPIALSLSRELKTSYVSVGSRTANAIVSAKKWGIFPTKKYLRFKLSNSARAFITNYDAFGPQAVEPSNFTLTKVFS